MTFPLTREDVSLILEALQLIGNDVASLLILEETFVVTACHL
jgi:hypothetical protein